MTNTEKILTEFDEKFPAYLNGERGDYTQAPLPAIKSFLSTSIAQAIVEERERVRGLIEKLRKVLLKSDTENINPFTTTLDGDYLHFYNQALNDLLASLDKPLTDKE